MDFCELGQIIDQLREKVRQFEENPDAALQEPDSAIQLVNRAIEFTREEDLPELHAMSSALLGQLQLQTSKADARAATELAISSFNTFLKLCPDRDYPKEWMAHAHGSLGSLLLQRPSGDPAQNIDGAISHLQQALDLSCSGADDSTCIDALYWLGVAYTRRRSGVAGDNRNMAISHFMRASELCEEKGLRYDWARLQSELSLAYLQGLSEEDADKAIESCNQALTVFSRSSDPERWAQAHHNLGLAYRFRSREQRAHDLEESLRHFHLALSVFDSEKNESHAALTCWELARLLTVRTGGDAEENLEQAVGFARRALDTYEKLDQDASVAQAQAALGRAYLRRKCGLRRENLEQAIAYLEAARRFYDISAHASLPRRVQRDLRSAELAMETLDD